MAVLVDLAVWRWRGRSWAHLVSDRDLEELHEIAARLGLERRWFQGDHYDVTAELRLAAIALGAQPVSSSELVLRLRAAGLRRGSRLRQLPGEVRQGLRPGEDRQGLRPTAPGQG